MAVLRIRPFPGASAELGKITDSRSRRQWLAIVSSRFDDDISIANYGWANNILPRPYVDFDPTKPAFLCRSLSILQDSQYPLKWICTADYSTQPLTVQEQLEQLTPPLDRPAKIRWKTNKYQIALDRDINGKAIVNSAGDPFDPPIEVPRSRWMCVISKNVSSVPEQLAANPDVTNSAPFQIQGVTIDINCARVVDMDLSDLQTETSPDNELWEYFVFTWAFELDPVWKWKLRPLDCGFREKQLSDSTKRVHIIDDNRQPVAVAQCLDGSGHRLFNPTSENVVFLSFDGYPQTDLNNFPLE